MAEHTVALTVYDGCYHLIDPVTTQPLLCSTAPAASPECSATGPRVYVPAP